MDIFLRAIKTTKVSLLVPLLASSFLVACNGENLTNFDLPDEYSLIGIKDIQAAQANKLNFDEDRIRLLVTYNERALYEAGSVLKAADFWSFDEDQYAITNRKIASSLSDIDVGAFTPLEGLPLATIEASVDQLGALEATGLFSYVMIDEQVPPNLESSGAKIGSGVVNIRGADGDGTTVAVIDSGVQSTHPFFDGRVVEGACYSSTFGTSISLCPSTTPDGKPATSGVTVASGENCTDAGLCYHGTHVAGIVAGEANGEITYSGVAPEADIMAIQIFHKEKKVATCSAFGFSTPCILSLPSDNVRALNRVLNRAEALNIVAVNMSMASGKHTGNCDTTRFGAVDPQKVVIDRLLSEHGVVTVASSGNNGYIDSIGSPSCISSVVAVGSVIDNVGNADDNDVSGFSNMSNNIDLLAPGSSIDSSTIASGYREESGTSMASPQVAGAIAALVSLDIENITPSDALDALESTGISVDDQRTNAKVKSIRIDLEAAAELLRPSPPRP